jgi:hypothetical protein
MTVEMPHQLSDTGTVKLIGNPVKMSEDADCLPQGPLNGWRAHGRGPARMVGPQMKTDLVAWQSSGVIDGGCGACPT